MSTPIFPTATTTQLATQDGYTLVCLSSDPSSHRIRILLIFIRYPDPTMTLFWIMLTPNGPHVDLNHDAILLPADPSQVADTVAHEPPSPGSNVAVDLPEEAIGLPGTLPDGNQ